MLEFNLLPEVKLRYVKAEKLKFIIIVISTIISIISVVSLGLLVFYVDNIQTNSINHLSSQIQSKISTLNSDTNLNKILTIQKQTNVLPNIQSQLFQTSRIFGYMSELTPSTASISSLNLTYSNSQISISGTTDSLATVNQFVDTLKFTTYTNNGKNAGTAFSNVVLNSFSYSTGNNPTYSMTFNFNNNIFIQKNSISLVVPSITTTRSILDQPNNLFQKGSI